MLIYEFQESGEVFFFYCRRSDQDWSNVMQGLQELSSIEQPGIAPHSGPVASAR